MDKLKDKIKSAIISQLRKKQVYKFAHYQDLVNDYMEFWDIKNMLQEDIAVRGVSISTASGSKKNESISELMKVNKQMLTILYDLGIRASDLKVAEDIGKL